MKYKYNAPFAKKMLILKGQKDVYVNDFVIMCGKKRIC